MDGEGFANQWATHVGSAESDIKDEIATHATQFYITSLSEKFSAPVASLFG